MATLARRWLGSLVAGLGLACAAMVPVQAAPQPQAKLVFIPGDQALQAMVAAVGEARRDRALAGLQFQVLPQALQREADIQRMAGARVVVARHMVGQARAPMTAMFQQLKADGARLYGAGSNAGVSDKLGLTEDATLTSYLEFGGADNLLQMIRFVAQRDLGLPVQAKPPQALPQAAMWLPATGQLFERFEDYAAAHDRAAPAKSSRPWVGVVINRGQAIGGSDELVKAVVQALDRRGLNALVAFGFPSTVPVERFLLDAEARPRVVAVAALGMKLGNVPDKIIPLLQRLDVPLVNGITLYQASRQEWEDSPVGLGLAERSWQIAGPEFAGIVAPTVVASKERRRDAATGLEYIAEVPIPERVERFAERLRQYTALRSLPAADKRVAVIYYNSPPGNQNIGASYLNVLPRSLWQILQRLQAEGYDTRGRPVSEDALFDRLREHGANVDSSKQGALAELVASGRTALLPVAEYQRWFDALPAKLRAPMLKAWGEPKDFKPMVWRDRQGQAYFVFPVQRFGKLLFAPQPARGWGDVKTQYHDPALPPHHQYLAFYLWLQKTEQVNAMVHVGTHATHEWLSGKEVGNTEADPGELMVGAVPQIYPYIVDVVGEGLQAKRRGMATLVSHMTPPFSTAGMNPDLAALRGLLNDYGVALQKSESAAQATLSDINRLAARIGVLKDIGLSELKTEEDAEHLQHHLEDIGQTQSPMGLHTFGVAASADARRQTAQAVVARQAGLTADEQARREAALAQLLLDSARAELDALVAGLAGRYVAAGPGGDPLRNPLSLPSGRNLYGFDPARLPTPGVYAQGEKLAAALMADYRKKHGSYPDRLLFNLWSNETMRHEGVMESQILSLLGVRPLWDGFGRVQGVEVIPRAELGRPRVDITITPSGLYRDTLPGLMLLLDKGVSAVKGLQEDDNPVLRNVQRTRAALQARGVAPEQAERLAAVRLFSQPPGAYGTGLDNVILAGNTWNSESQVIEVYLRRVGHLFGQGFWGDAPSAPGSASGSAPDSAPGAAADPQAGAALAVDVFRQALSGVKAVLHTRASNLYGTLDNDDVFQAVGGAAMAVRQIDGATPQTFMVNLADPARARNETLDQFMGREMQTRYLNPRWIQAMLKEGYAGARFVSQVVDNLWGWQVTVPEAVDGTKWQQMFETYVQDKHQLDIQNQFRSAKNLLAYQALVDRMLVAINKGYWKAAPEVVAELQAKNRELMAEAGVACNRDSCSSDEVTRISQVQDEAKMAGSRSGYGLAAPAGGAAVRAAAAPALTSPTPSAPAALPPAPPAVQTPDTVRGQQLRETPRSQPIQQLLWAYAALLGAVLMAGVAWQAWRTRRELRPALPSNTGATA
jgi:cobaltochelatase CobN